MTEETIEAWHFLPNDRRLRWGSREFVYPGHTISVDCVPKLCEQGLHASTSIINALEYAPGSVLCRVVVGGSVVHGSDKIAGTTRTALWIADAAPLLRSFACLLLIAAQVIHRAVNVGKTLCLAPDRLITDLACIG